MTSAVSILDIGLGNISAFMTAFRKLDVDFEVITTRGQIRKSNRILMPGIGTFDQCIMRLEQNGTYEALGNHLFTTSKPFLGVCLGMHILFNKSEEGTRHGFGFIKDEITRLDCGDLLVPHLGWNQANIVGDMPLPIDKTDYFYFTHSYAYVRKTDSTLSGWLTTDYGPNFISGIIKDNVIGLQFHPEKSHISGYKLLHHFSCM